MTTNSIQPSANIIDDLHIGLAYRIGTGFRTDWKLSADGLFPNSTFVEHCGQVTVRWDRHGEDKPLTFFAQGCQAKVQTKFNLGSLGISATNQANPLVANFITALAPDVRTEASFITGELGVALTVLDQPLKWETARMSFFSLGFQASLGLLNVDESRFDRSSGQPEQEINLWALWARVAFPFTLVHWYPHRRFSVALSVEPILAGGPFIKSHPSANSAVSEFGGAGTIRMDF